MSLGAKFYRYSVETQENKFINWFLEVQDLKNRMILPRRSEELKIARAYLGPGFFTIFPGPRFSKSNKTFLKAYLKILSDQNLLNDP